MTAYRLRCGPERRFLRRSGDVCGPVLAGRLHRNEADGTARATSSGSPWRVRWASPSVLPMPGETREPAMEAVPAVTLNPVKEFEAESIELLVSRESRVRG